MTMTKEDIFLEPARKISIKRCLSPVKPSSYDSIRETKRKSGILQPVHPRILSNPAAHHAEAMQLAGGQLDLARGNLDLVGGGAGVEQEEEAVSPSTDLTHSVESRTQSEDDSTGDLFGSYNSVQSGSFQWPGSSQVGSCSHASSHHYSTSFTSWTRPEAGNRVSDSCVPHSSILDREHSVRLLSRSRSIRKTSRKSSFKLKRDSSADTSKDIDDIEDFELDDGTLEDLLHDEELDGRRGADDGDDGGGGGGGGGCVGLGNYSEFSTPEPPAPPPPPPALTLVGRTGHHHHHHHHPQQHYEFQQSGGDELTK